MTGDGTLISAAAPSRAALGGLARRAALPAAVIGAVAVVLRVVYDPWYLNYDARYALLWAGDLWHGARPDYGTPFAPTPHPMRMCAILSARCRSWSSRRPTREAQGRACGSFGPYA